MSRCDVSRCDVSRCGVSRCGVSRCDVSRCDVSRCGVIMSLKGETPVLKEEREYFQYSTMQPCLSNSNCLSVSTLKTV